MQIYRCDETYLGVLPDKSHSSMLTSLCYYIFMIPIYFAPLEDVAGYVFRNLHNRFFPGTDRYHAAFISAAGSEKRLKKRELEDIDPENNSVPSLIPQILTNRADEFLNITEMLIEKGYKEINLNLGCPSKDVVKRKRGSGFLAVPDKLDSFFEDLFDGIQKRRYGSIRISVKTRIGYRDSGNADNLIKIFNTYPLSEVTVHPRLGKDFYRGKPDMETFDLFYSGIKHPIVYNGDIRSVNDIMSLLKKYPRLSAVMAGRGMIRNPALAREYKGGSPIQLSEIMDFTDELYITYKSTLNAGIYAVNKLKELWGWIGENPLFEEHRRGIRAILKSGSAIEYESAVRSLKK